MFYFTNSQHLYTLASNNKKVKDGLFHTRQEAREKMYNYIDKKGLKVVEK